MKLLITGVTRTGNLGGTAMLCAVEAVLRDRVDEIQLASIIPARDAAQQGPDSTRIIPADYRVWLLVAAPFCIIFWPLRHTRPVRWLASRMPILSAFANVDKVIDLSGIAFVDGRGLALLYYNVAVTLPALFLDKPVHKLAQALGPFKSPFNRMAARWTLLRCKTVAARGKITLNHLRDFGMATPVLCPDVSFALDIPEAMQRRAHAEMAAARKTTGDEFAGSTARPPLVVISPSAVVAAYCRHRNIDMISVMATAIEQLMGLGVAVALLPHATDTGISKNDDKSVVAAIVERIGVGSGKVVVLDPGGDPRLARALIGQADVFVASRFHSLIAALSQSVPVMTVGWSHKYVEAAEPFGMEAYAVDYSELDAGALVARIKQLIDNRQVLRERMIPVASEAARAARAGIEVVLRGDP